jgi:DUF1365 family protein
MAEVDAPIRFADAEVFHARLGPKGLRFRYRVLALFVDLDRMDETAPIPLFSVGRFNLFGFNAADHGPRDGSSLRAHIDRLHRDAGLARSHQITLTCFPRILGHVFNPIATYACADATGRTTSVVYEVRNTFGEHHTYLMPVRSDADGTVAPHECDKLFYVSPFMDMPLRYRFRIAPPRDGAFSLKIIERNREGVVLTALMQARTFVPTRAALLRRLIATPLAGFKVLAGIHAQALRLWFRGHRIRPRPIPPPPVSLGVTGAYSSSTAQISGHDHA